MKLVRSGKLGRRCYSQSLDDTAPPIGLAKQSGDVPTVQRSMFDPIAPLVPIPLQCIATAKRQAKYGWFSSKMIPLDTKEFCSRTANLIFGSNISGDTSKRVVSCQANSQYDALEVIAQYLQTLPNAPSTVYVPSPSPTVHELALQENGMRTEYYRYYDAEEKALDFAGLLDDINQAPANSVILLQATAHNPTGLELSEAQWLQILEACDLANHWVLLDCSNQGISSGNVEYDVFPVKLAMDQGITRLIAFQNTAYMFGLTEHRDAAVVHILTNEDKLAQVEEALAPLRKKDLNLEGSTLISMILKDAELTQAWKTEVKKLTQRTSSIRIQLHDTLIGPCRSQRDWTYLMHQKGLYCYFPHYTHMMKDRLRTAYFVSIYSDGRLPLSGLTADGIPWVADALHQITRTGDDEAFIFTNEIKNAIRQEQLKGREERRAARLAKQAEDVKVAEARE